VWCAPGPVDGSRGLAAASLAGLWFSS